MRPTILGLLLLGVVAPAQAQMPDYCSDALARQTSAALTLDWRLRCTIQKLEAERVQQADRATQDEVEIARLAALLKSAEAALDRARAAKERPQAKEHPKW